MQNIEYTSPEKMQFGYLDANKRYPFHFSCPLSDEITHYNIRLFAHVGEQTQSVELSCELAPTAISLWHEGQQKEALQLEIRQEWLEQYQEQQFKQNKTGSNRDNLITLIQLATFYQTLEKEHPDNDILTRYVKDNIILPFTSKNLGLPKNPHFISNDHPDNQNDAMQFIQGGEFQAVYLSSPNEPIEKVIINDFYLSKTLVTVKDYSACVEAGACQQPEWLEDDSHYHIKTGSDDFYQQMGEALTNDEHPIVGISWNDAMTYIKWLSVKTGIVYSLPTEAEWEYATRVGCNTDYPWGERIDSKKANYSDCHLYSYTSPVASFKPYNGLYDMQGNVWEWTASPYTTGNDQENHLANNHCYYILRGGSWLNQSPVLSLNYRYWNIATLRRPSVGFRLAKII
jgi:formylglycine-generating enzyme required for sulfatase activity